ncbi:MAG: peptide chain release factor 2 [Gemmataceae bacterium]
MNPELRRRTDDMSSRLAQLRDSLDVAGKIAERDRLTNLMGTPNFWDNPDKAQKVIGQLKPLNALLKPYHDLASGVSDVEALAELSGEDASLEAEWERELAKVSQKLDVFELKAMLSGPADPNNAFVRIQAGAGGTDACDWAQMLERMYMRWAERHGYQVEIQDEQKNLEAGIQSCQLRVVGEYAYGYLQGESGVHRLVRMSPFGKGDTRQTSFAAVDVTPELDDSINIEVRECDLRRDTFRSGGPGGQHQNKTESGVRYTHTPTGVAAESRSERSQVKNDANALALLKAKLYKLEEQKRMAAVEKTYDEKGDVAWGNQIRNYVLQPYTMVKDVRLGVETSQVQTVLDGDIDQFMEAYLRQKTEKLHAKK